MNVFSNTLHCRYELYLGARKIRTEFRRGRALWWSVGPSWPWLTGELADWTKWYVPIVCTVLLPRTGRCVEPGTECGTEVTYMTLSEAKFSVRYWGHVQDAVWSQVQCTSLRPRTWRCVEPGAVFGTCGYVHDAVLSQVQFTALRGHVQDAVLSQVQCTILEGTYTVAEWRTYGYKSDIIYKVTCMVSVIEYTQRQRSQAVQSGTKAGGLYISTHTSLHYFCFTTYFYYCTWHRHKQRRNKASS